MKKTLYINLNGFAFHIDEDAYDKLNQYLRKIEGSFPDKDEAKEIVSDIEARIAELFSGKKKSSEQVITLKEVEEVIDTMGEPQEIADEDQAEPQSDGSNASMPGSPLYKKRLYRDPESRVLGGVCGGLGAYFDMDPLVFRVIFILAFVLYGASLPVYVVLWIVMPKALTITQKLEMKGPAGYESWEQHLKNEYKEVAEKFKQSRAYKDFSGSFSKRTDVVGDALRTLLRIVVSVVGVVLMFIAIAFLVSLIVTFTLGFTIMDFSGVGNYFTSLPALFVGAEDMVIGSVGLVLVTCIPLIVLFYLGFKLVFRFRSKYKIVAVSSLVLWIAGLILLFYAFARVAREYRVTEDVYQNEKLELPQSSVVYLKANVNTYMPTYHDHLFDFNRLDIYCADNKLYVQGRPRIDLVRGDSFAIEIKRSAKGKSISQAKINCQDIEFFWMLRDSTIHIDPLFTLRANSKLRDQGLNVVILVPESVQVEVADELEWVVNNRLDD
ncbi:PspC domain-containing protein [Saccharicrinis fermentans]|uniref:DNA-binding transcriptional activator PspC n=1 Tax=Saccharicrinis fermentans DSM 9555 = JCM 21142 TaxID=869213 RepID=W7YKF1_9BACT|nr:PspC domain-containing protein [Saccharicrinis fermentans]GAF02834.1 DNA-binding transcriptional activator PspC [Saccharicrinis fermentans DSM 9555 = JCM 21142]